MRQIKPAVAFNGVSKSTAGGFSIKADVGDEVLLAAMRVDHDMHTVHLGHIGVIALEMDLAVGLQVSICSLDVLPMAPKQFQNGSKTVPLAGG